MHLNVFSVKRSMCKHFHLTIQATELRSAFANYVFKKTLDDPWKVKRKYNISASLIYIDVSYIYTYL